MGLEGAFRKVFGRKGLGEASSPAGYERPQLHLAMIGELQRLDLFQVGLGRLAQSYVATGAPADFLSSLEAITAKYPQTSYGSPYLKDNGAVNDAQGRVDVALIRGEIPASPAIARFVAIRRLVRPMASQAGWGQKPYPESQMLSRELFSSLLQGEGRLNSHSYHIQPPPPIEPTISPRAILALLNQTGGDATDYFELALIYNSHDRISGHPEFVELVTAQPDRLAAAFERLRSDAQYVRGIGLVERLGLLNLPAVLAQVVNMLGKGHGKDARKAAATALARLDPARLHEVLRRELGSPDLEIRFGLVEAAGQARTPEILALLAERSKVEKAAKVKAAIDAILEVAQSSGTGSASDPANPDGYLAIDGAQIALPARKDLGKVEIPAPSDAACIEFVEIVKRFEIDRQALHVAHFERHGRPGQTIGPAPVPYPAPVIEATFATLTEGAAWPQGMDRELLRRLGFREDFHTWLKALLAPVSINSALRLLRAGGLERTESLVQGRGFDRSELFGVELLRSWIEAGRLELRDLADADLLRNVLGNIGYNRPDSPLPTPLYTLPGEAVWPWLAQNMAVFDEALGLHPAKRPIPLARALTGIALLPATPQRYYAKLLEIAVAEKRPLRLQARALLRAAKGLTARIEALLDDKRQQVRINAAAWLADIRSTASEPALRKRLKKERSDPVRAALIVAMQRLGIDLTDVIGPASLIAEAQGANAKSPPALPEWLAPSGLPPLHFRDGSVVPHDVVAYWLALAIRLKDPAAHGQFGIYLDQLDPADARGFSNWMLESWIAYDTRSSGLEEATAYAQANYQMHEIWMYTSHKTPELRDRAIAAMTREKAGELLNSGSDTKGLLALACRADPVWAANRVRWFLKKHGRRSNQAMALLEALAGTGAPAALQVVIAASARLKQKSTQARAAEIAERFAEDRGWSVDELADRTVPTGGFDDDGELELPCGEDEKVYLARLDAQLAIHLFNPDGKPVKGLPAGDDEATREAKKAYSATRKELAQVIELQAARLFEAMCVERGWGVADWRLAFHEHPVMRRLIERLVWQGLDAEGNPLGLFRPTQEGDFTDAADNSVEIDRFATVRLAHGALVDQATCASWIAHLKDYEVKPFLTQFDTLRAPLTEELAGAEAIIDRQGWKADSLTYRGIAEKRGYQRVMRDGGGCNEYVKEFPSHGITATIFHTGSYAVDENNPVALKELRITKRGHRGAYTLKDVPPVMLAECWADYHAIAAKGSFDPDWEKIAPW
jgi:HEAT repeat protein